MACFQGPDLRCGHERSTVRNSGTLRQLRFDSDGNGTSRTRPLQRPRQVDRDRYSDPPPKRARASTRPTDGVDLVRHVDALTCPDAIALQPVQEVLTALRRVSVNQQR
jgi:hypothetical protein